MDKSEVDKRTVLESQDGARWSPRLQFRAEEMSNKQHVQKKNLKVSKIF